MFRFAVPFLHGLARRNSYSLSLVSHVPDFLTEETEELEKKRLRGPGRPPRADTADKSSRVRQGSSRGSSTVQRGRRGRKKKEERSSQGPATVSNSTSSGGGESLASVTSAEFEAQASRMGTIRRPQEGQLGDLAAALNLAVRNNSKLMVPSSLESAPGYAKREVSVEKMIQVLQSRRRAEDEKAAVLAQRKEADPASKATSSISEKNGLKESDRAEGIIASVMNNVNVPGDDIATEIPGQQQSQGGNEADAQMSDAQSGRNDDETSKEPSSIQITGTELSDQSKSNAADSLTVNEGNIKSEETQSCTDTGGMEQNSIQQVPQAMTLSNAVESSVVKLEAVPGEEDNNLAELQDSDYVIDQGAGIKSPPAVLQSALEQHECSNLPVEGVIGSRKRKRLEVGDELTEASVKANFISQSGKKGTREEVASKRKRIPSLPVEEHQVYEYVRQRQTITDERPSEDNWGIGTVRRNYLALTSLDTANISEGYSTGVLRAAPPILQDAFRRNSAMRLQLQESGESLAVKANFHSRTLKELQNNYRREMETSKGELLQQWESILAGAPLADGSCRSQGDDNDSQAMDWMLEGGPDQGVHTRREHTATIQKVLDNNYEILCNLQLCQLSREDVGQPQQEEHQLAKELLSNLLSVCIHQPPKDLVSSSKIQECQEQILEGRRKFERK